MTAMILDGLAMAKVIHTEITQEVNLMKEKYGVVPGLAIVRVGDNSASKVYVRNKCIAAEKVGMSVYEYWLPLQTSHTEAKHIIENLNTRADLHGIIVQLPLPKQIKEDELMESIDPHKDVDGLHPVNVGLLMSGKPHYIPATPLAIQQLLLRSGYNPEGKHVVVCGRSKIVGKPIAALLMQKIEGCNATVTVCHAKTENLANITQQADILIVAVGNPGVVTEDFVKPGAVVIDVGINRVEDPERRSGYRLVGDVHYDKVSQKAGAITPVPGGVGPMTIAMLLKNTLQAARHFISQR
jgi:methylenetetrahydrofolate dehydrogenase (NADP+)/methenyltetrahydrofolate cyclohydrolase